jgi:hypothetical protein
MSKRRNPDRAEEHPDSDLGTPVCPQCLTPFHEGQYYCRKCGYAVGTNTPYIPWINIPFGLSIYKHLWHKIWYDKRTSLLLKVLYLIFVALAAPIMLVGAPFTLWSMSRDRKRHDA